MPIEVADVGFVRSGVWVLGDPVSGSRYDWRPPGENYFRYEEGVAYDCRRSTDSLEFVGILSWEVEMEFDRQDRRSKIIRNSSRLLVIRVVAHGKRAGNSGSVPFRHWFWFVGACS